MTQPAGDAPGAQTATATPETGTAPGAPANTAPPAAGLDPNAPIDFASLPANVQKYFEDLRRENGSHRQGKTAAERELAAAKQRNDAVLNALGLNADGSAAVDPQQAISALSQRANAAEDAAWGAQVRLNIYQRAGALGANAEALLDSVSFQDSLDEIADADPSTATFRAAMDAKITAALAANPTLRAGSTPSGSSGGEFSGGSGAGQPITEEQLARMSPEQIAKAHSEGKLAHLL